MSYILNSVKDLFRSGMYNTEYAANVFDWEKAARMIVEYRPKIAYVAIKNYISVTKREIFKNGKALYPSDGTFYSIDNIPVIILDNHRPMQCYKKEYEVEMFEGWTPKALAYLDAGFGR